MKDLEAAIKLGHFVKTQRMLFGLSQSEFCEKIGISQPMLSRIENGERKITGVELLKIISVLGIEADALIELTKSNEFRKS